MEKQFDIDKMILIIGSGILSYVKWLKIKPTETFIPPTDEDVELNYIHSPKFNSVVNCIIANIKDHLTKR